MQGFWLSSPQIAHHLGISNRCTHKRLGKYSVRTRKRFRAKGMEYDLTSPEFPADWRARIEAALGRRIGVQEPAQRNGEPVPKGFRIFIDVRLEDLIDD